MTLLDLNLVVQKLELQGFRRFPKLLYITDSTFWFMADTCLFIYNERSKQAEVITHVPRSARFKDTDSLSTFSVAYTQDNNLFIAAKDRQIQITHDTVPGIVNGQAVHRREFGITHSPVNFSRVGTIR